MTDDLTPEYLDLLKWAFGLNARMPLNWAIKAQEQARAAAVLFERSRAARRLSADLFYRDCSGLPVARPQPLTPEEQTLLPDVEMYRVAFMLLGAAIEDLAKGILVGRNPTWVKDGKLDPRLTTHDLKSLTQRCEVSVPEADQVALRVLTEHVVWAGRYHIPKSAKHVARLTTRQRLLLAQSDDYLDAVFNFGERLVEQLAKLCEDEHATDKAAARIALARAEDDPNPPTRMKPDGVPWDAFNVAAPRACPYCSRPVTVPIMDAETTGTGNTTTLDAPQHEPPACERWLRAERTDPRGLALHVLAGRSGEPYIGTLP